MTSERVGANEARVSTVTIGSKKVGPGQAAYVVAEMAWSHDASVEKAKIIIDGAARAGADAVNFHLTSLPDYMVPCYGAGPGRLSGNNQTSNVFEYLNAINLPFPAFSELTSYAKTNGLAVSVMCNDDCSLNFTKTSIAADLLMIHPSAAGDERFLRRIASIGTPVLIYTGGLKLGEIENSVEWATSEGNNRLILQHGFQSYPTALADNHLRSIGTLKRQFGYPVAFADHTDGDDPMAMIVPLLAVAMGADMVEKHITHDRSVKGEDFESALGPRDFAVFVDQLRKAEQTFGAEAWRPLSERQLKYRSVSRKRAVAAKKIVAGTRLTRDIVAFKRCDSGFYPEEISTLYTHVLAARDIEENTPLTWELFR